MSECADTSNSMQRRKRLPPAHIHLSATDLQRTSLSMTGTRAACYTGFTFPRHTVGPQIGRKSSTLTRSLRLLSLRQALVLLGLACSAPATLVAALTVYEDYRLHKERIYQATVSIARSMTVDWEREIHGVTAGLERPCRLRRTGSRRPARFSCEGAADRSIAERGQLCACRRPAHADLEYSP